MVVRRVRLPTLLPFAAIAFALAPVAAFSQRPAPGDYVRVGAEGGLEEGGARIRPWGLALRGLPELPPIPVASSEDEADSVAGAEEDAGADAFFLRLAVRGSDFVRVPLSPAEEGAAGADATVDRLVARARPNGFRLWMGASTVLGTATSNDVSILDDPASAEAWAASFERYPDGRLWLDGSLARVWDPRLELLAVDRLRGRVRHFNEFTGRRWADDPAVALWEIEGPDGWHDRLAAGEDLSMPDATFRFLDAQYERWLYARYGADDVPDEPSAEDRAAFLESLWDAHKRRVADQFRLWGESARLAPLAWRGTTAPSPRTDASGVFAVYARPEDLARVSFPTSGVRVVRLWTPPPETRPLSADGEEGESPELPWKVFKQVSGRVDAVAWDADAPTNDVASAFDAAFAAAGAAFRLGLSPASAPPPADPSAPEDDAVRLTPAQGVSWIRASDVSERRSLAIDAVPGLSLGVAGPEPSHAAVGAVRESRERFALFLAVPDGRVPILLWNPESAAGPPPLADTLTAEAVDASGTSVFRASFPASEACGIALPPKAFRVSLSADSAGR